MDAKTGNSNNPYTYGKIYKMGFGVEGVYYGFTTRSLKVRLKDHKRNITPSLSIALSRVSNPTIELVHMFPCNTHSELIQEETRVITAAVNRGENVLNINQRGRKKAMEKKSNRSYYLVHKNRYNKRYRCEVCDYCFDCLYRMNRHLASRKHKLFVHDRMLENQTRSEVSRMIGINAPVTAVTTSLSCS